MAEKPKQVVGLIIGSQRVVRVAPEVAQFVLETITASQNKDPTSATSASNIEIELIDLKTYNLPMFDEPGIPNRIMSPEDYEHEHTRVWARRIAACDAFIFLSAQRNWGIPSELKNSIDYLFNEWKGKPVMIVTYGGHGGNQCAGHLKTVLGCIKMLVVDQMVNMSFASKDMLQRAFKGEPLGLDAADDDGPWAGYRGEIVTVWNQMVESMMAKGGGA